MKMVGPFAASLLLDTATVDTAQAEHTQAEQILGQTVSAWQALERVTGLSALLYVLPSGVTIPELPASDVLLPYTVTGQEDTLSYAACDLPPAAQHPTDPLAVAQATLRALITLHEAGLVHGALGPQQLWLLGGEVRLAGAGLPWAGRVAPYAAPEGVNGTPEADLYALGITLLRLGPLPEGLTGLLSEYPAQRPSARDALARLNAGPRLSEKLPLIVDAPRPKLPAELLSTAEPLPLVADPDARMPDIVLDDTVLIPDAKSRAAQQAREMGAQERAQQPAADPTTQTPTQTADGPRVVRVQVPPAAPPGLPAETSPPPVTDQDAPLLPTSPQGDIESLLGQFDLFEAGSPAASSLTPDLLLPGPPLPKPEQGDAAQQGDTAQVNLAPSAPHRPAPSAPEVADLTLNTLELDTHQPQAPSAVPAGTETVAEPLYPAVPHPEGETIHIPELEETELPTAIEPIAIEPTAESHASLKRAEDALIPASGAAQPPANMVMPAPAGPTPPVARRQFKPVKMKWDTGDESWHVQHDGGSSAAQPATSTAVTSTPTPSAAPAEAQGLLTSQPVAPQPVTARSGPQPKVAPASASTRAKASTFTLASVPRWFWVAVLAALLMVGLLWGLGKIMSANREVGGTVTPPGMATGTASGACCSLPVQVFSAQGEALSVPVQFILRSGPAASHLQAGQQVSAGGVLHFDAPGHYLLSVQAESYHPGQIGVDVPASTPLHVILK